MMAINPVEKSQVGHYTIDDLIAMPDDDKRHELIDGEIVQMGTSSQKHSTLGAWLLIELGIFLRMNNLGGRINGADGTYQLDDANTRVPDVSWLSSNNVAKLPVGTVFVPFAPDFVIEIKSPSDSRIKMRRLAQQYLKAGSQLVWTIDYEDQVVHVHRPGQPVIELADEDILEGYDLLPGFKISLTDMFAKIADL